MSDFTDIESYPTQWQNMVGTGVLENYLLSDLWESWELH